MPKGPEARFWRWLRRRLLQQVPGVHLTRVENSAEPGMPDVNYCLEGYESTLELKYTSRFPLKHKVSTSQRIWLRRRSRAGASVRVVVGTPKRIYLFRDAGVFLVNRLKSVGQAEREAQWVGSRSTRSLKRLLEPSPREVTRGVQSKIPHHGSYGKGADDGKRNDR